MATSAVTSHTCQACFTHRQQPPRNLTRGQGGEGVNSTVIHIRSEASVPDHVVWSLFNTLFMNSCSVKSRDRKMVGDLTGAQAYASTAKCLNIWALIVGIFVPLHPSTCHQ
uniref:Uncharacterized protein n=1 Tax=Callithrix jacchus TaxID=9483 RepID=A0A8I3W9M1_CALJA